MLPQKKSLFTTLILISLYIFIFQGKCLAQTVPELIWQPFPTSLEAERDEYGRIVNYRDKDGHIFMHLYNSGQLVNEYNQYVRFRNIGATGEVELNIRLHNGSTTIKEFSINHYISSGECDTLLIGGKAQTSSTPTEYTMSFTSPEAVATDSSGVSFTVDSEYYKTITRASIKGEELSLFSSPKLITDQDYDARYIHPADLDGDGDQDFISVDYNNFKIYWHENMDGNGVFSTSHVIDSSSGPASIHAADLNSDGSMDVLSPFCWYENIDGEGSFNKHESFEGQGEVIPADLDNDGDSDVVIANYYPDPMVWFENIDGAGNFNVGDTIVSEHFVWNFDIADINNDGYKDLLFSVDDEIFWCENTDGEGTFGPEQSIPNLYMTLPTENPTSVCAADLDGDDDLEVLAGLGDGQKVIWYENTDGAGSFGEQQLFGTSPPYYRIPVCTADFDNDGDMDVLSGSSRDFMWDRGTTKLVWYENVDGSALFGEHIILLSEYPINDIVPADLDSDGDLDLLSAYYYDDYNVVWFENLHGELPTNIDTPKNTQIHFNLKQNYPNPFNPETTIEFTVVQPSHVVLTVYNLLGEEIERFVNRTISPGEYKVQFDGSDLPSGIYLCKLKIDRNYKIIKMTLIK